MKVLSLFDGMACGMIAMRAAGIEVDRYVAYEIDKCAIQTSSHNFPMIEHRGDVFEADFSEFVGFDWLIGGSPCTYWSIAQKNNRETEASGIGWELFSQYVRALHEAQPKYFIYENNKSMSKQIRASIDEAFGFDAVLINSALVSAQNRQRLYWVGKRNADGTYSKVNVEQPINRGILLKDILENGCDLTSSYDGAVPWNTIERNQRNMVSEPVRIGTYPNEAKNQDKHDSQPYRIYSTEGKGVTLCGNGGGLGAKTGLYAVPLDCDAVITENSIRCQRRDQKHSTVQGSHVNFTDGKTQTLSPSHIPNVIERKSGKKYPVYEVRNGLIAIKDKQYPIKLADGYYIIRKLTVRECMRLQTVPEWYEFPVSKAQAYKMLGNGWTVDVIKHLITSAYSRPVVIWTKQITFDEFV